jgi:hypothetical protein
MIVVGFVLLVLVVRHGFGWLMDFADPGGAGPIIMWPLSGARLPHVARNLGAVVLCIGALLRVLHWTDDHGSKAMVWGAVLLAGGIFGPPIIAWLASGGVNALSECLDHPNTCMTGL